MKEWDALFAASRSLSTHRRAPWAVLGVGLVVLGTAVAGVVHPPTTPRPTAALARTADSATAPDSPVALPVPAAPVQVLASAPALPSATRSRQAARALPVAPLKHLRVPDLVITAPQPFTPEQVRRLRAVRGLTALSLLDVATVRVGSKTVHLAGVDPSTFRPFTPQVTARSNPLWVSVAKGEMAASYAARLPLGGTLPVGRTPLRVGAVAAYDLPGTDVVVAHGVAQSLGARQRAALVAAPDRGLRGLQRDVRAAVGTALTITVLRPEKVVSHRPTSYRELYMLSAKYCPGLSWHVLAAIGQVESGHGQNVGPSSAGALGPMQFLPSTWSYYGVDGDGDGKADIMSAYDAVPAAALYLCRNGAGRGGKDLYNAIFAYNHADWYVKLVLGLAAQYT